MTRIKLATFSTLGAIGLHAYLAWVFYPIKFAQATGESLCNINATFNCDAVAASSFSSFLGMPMALWGMSTNIVFLLVLLIYSLRFTDESEKALRNTFYLAFFIALVSVVMGIISLFLVRSFCLFCIGAYLCSFITLAAIWPLTQFKVPLLISDLRGLLTQNRNFLFLLIAIPIFTYLVHSSMMREYGAEKLHVVIQSSLNDWRNNPQHVIDVTPSLHYGPDSESAKLVISEFADFLCSHCKHAAPSLEAFAKSHPNVRLEFYSFALDGECNDDISQKVGAPCLLAKAVYCSGKTEKGWKIHDLIFKNQSQFYSSRTASASLEVLQSIAEKQVGNWSEFLECINSEESLEHIKKQGKTGKTMGVEGTPTIFANGKKLPRGQLLPVLQSLYEQLK